MMARRAAALLGRCALALLLGAPLAAAAQTAGTAAAANTASLRFGILPLARSASICRCAATRSAEPR